MSGDTTGVIRFKLTSYRTAVCPFLVKPSKSEGMQFIRVQIRCYTGRGPFTVYNHAFTRRATPGAADPGIRSLAQGSSSNVVR